MYSIVFSDVDGTLLNDNHDMTLLTRQAIKNIQNQNIEFVIVSARSPSGIFPILKKNSFECPIIAYSGALILDCYKNVIFEKGMRVNQVIEVIQYIEKEQFDMSWCIYSFDQWIVKDRQDPRIQREEDIVEALSIEGTIDDIAKLPIVHKILCICHPKHILYIEKMLKNNFPQLMIVKSSSILIEIMQKDISKALSVKKFCQLSGIDVNHAIAFGDQYNDLDMLKIVGCGIAMGNAPLDIREEIGRVTSDNNHDGIYKSLCDLNVLK